MKLFLLIASLFCSPSCFALTFEVKGSAGELLLSRTKNLALPSNVGKVSVEILDEAHAPYEGGEGGLSQLFGLGQKVEVISDQEMKAYGWCFSVDGLTPDTMSDATPVTKQDSHVEWYYAYAHYLNGQWVAQCARSEKP